MKIHGVTKETNLGNGGVEKAYFLSIPHFDQIEPQVALLVHHSGHHLTGWSWRAGRKQLVQNPCKPSPRGTRRPYRPWTEASQASTASTAVIALKPIQKLCQGAQHIGG